MTRRTKTRYETIRYDAERVMGDMAARGWMLGDLAQAASLSLAAISLFLNNKRQTPKTAAAIARAMGYSPRRYLLKSEAA